MFGQISISDKIKLGILFIIHWIIVIVFSTYILWSKPNWDCYFISAIVILVIHWLILNDCIITKLERDILLQYTEIDHGHPSLQFFTGLNIYTFLLLLIINICYCVNIFIVFNRNFSFIISLLLTIIFAIYLSYYRYLDIITLINKQNLK